MGFLDSLSEGLSSVTHILGTTAQAVGQVAQIAGAVGGMLPLEEDGPIVEQLHRAVGAAQEKLMAKALDTLQNPPINKTATGSIFTAGTPTFVNGIVRKKRVLSALSPGQGGAGRVSATALVNTTPLMYRDLSALFAQLGVDAQGQYEGVKADNALLAANALYANSEPVNPENPAMDTGYFVVNSKEGHPVLGLATASYNLKLDDTGKNDASHMALVYAPNSSLSFEHLQAIRARRIEESSDIWRAPPANTADVGQLGWKTVVNVTDRSNNNITGLLKAIGIFGNEIGWNVSSLVNLGSTISATISTLDSPSGVQSSFYDWLNGNLSADKFTPPPKNQVQDVIVQSSVPTAVA